MAIQLSLYSNDSNATEYTDTNSNNRIDLYSADSYTTNTGQYDTSTLQVMFHYEVAQSGGGYEYHADLTPWVTESWDSSNSQNVYGLSTAPITGGVSATYLYAEDYQGNQISSLSDFSRVHNVYYSIETEQVDSMETTISVDFSSNTATFGTGTLYTFQGTDATGGTSGYWTDSATEVTEVHLTRMIIIAMARWVRAIMTQSRGVHILGPNTLVGHKQSATLVQDGTRVIPDIRMVGSDSISPQLVITVHRARLLRTKSGSYFGDFYPCFSLCRGWYLWGRLDLYDNVGSFGSGYYSDDGNYEVLGSDSDYQIYGSAGYYDSVIGSGSFLGSSAEYYSNGYYGPGWYANGSMGSGSMGSYYSGSSGETLFNGGSSSPAVLVTTPMLQEAVG